MRSLPWRLAIVVLTAGCGPAFAASGRDIDEQTVQALYGEVTQALSAAAGLTLPSRVPAVLLTAAEARERRRAYTASLEQDAGVTYAIDLAADFVFSEGMLGRYLPDEKVLYVIRDVLDGVAGEREMSAEDLLFAIMAHELVHAYDDQVYAAIPHPADLLELSASGAHLPETQARMSFVEGRATWAAELACQHAGRQAFETHSVQDARDAEVMRAGRGDGAAERVGKGMVNVLARAKLVQYAQGREFARRAWSFGGEKFVAEVYRHMPLTLAELEDFERFKQRWALEEEAALDAQEAAEPGGDPSAPARADPPDDPDGT